VVSADQRYAHKDDPTPVPPRPKKEVVCSSKPTGTTRQPTPGSPLTRRKGGILRVPANPGIPEQDSTRQPPLVETRTPPPPFSQQAEPTPAVSTPAVIIPPTPATSGPSSSDRAPKNSTSISASSALGTPHYGNKYLHPPGPVPDPSHPSANPLGDDPLTLGLDNSSIPGTGKKRPSTEDMKNLVRVEADLAEHISGGCPTFYKNKQDSVTPYIKKDYDQWLGKQHFWLCMLSAC
jgi:hypothetical protein